MSCGVTILTCAAGYRAAKSYAGDDQGGFTEVSNYDLGWRYGAEAVVLHDLDGLAAVIRRVAALPDANGVLVRGALTARARDSTGWVNRRMNPKSADDIPSLRPEARRWIMCDLDKFPCPEGLSVRRPVDHQAIIAAAIQAELHPAFHAARCFYQFSNSAGLTSSLAKMHLFFWLSAPIEDVELRKIQRSFMPNLDHSVLNPVQPHYIAHPVLTAGQDPLAGHRLGWREGAEQVVLPDLPAPAPKPKRLPQRCPEALEATPGSRPTTASVGFLDDLVRSLGDGPNRQGFHDPLRRAVVRYAGQVAGGHTPQNDAGLIGLLLRLIAAAPAAPGRPDTYNDTYLRRLIDGAHRYIAAQEPLA